MARKRSHEDGAYGIDPLPVEGDRVDQILALWREEFPRRETNPIGLLLRIARIHRDIYRALLTAVSDAVPSVDIGTFWVLLLLRLSGPPYEASPSWLADMLRVYPTHLSNLLERLRANGLIERRRSSVDRRRIAIRLTPEGEKAIEKAFDAHFRTQKRLVSPLNDDDFESLAVALRKLVVHFEGPAGNPRRWQRRPPLPNDDMAPPVRKRARR